MQSFYNNEFYSIVNNFKSKCEENGLNVEWISDRIGFVYGFEELMIKVGLGIGNIPNYRLDTDYQISTYDPDEFIRNVTILFFERLEHAY